MKNTTKRIFVSVLTLVLTVVAVGTTTFAWFSLSNVATISNISGSVQGGEGLDVRISHTNYDGMFRNNLSTADWNAFLEAKGMKVGTNQEFKFGAVSTDNGLNFTYLEQEVGSNNLKITDAIKTVDGTTTDHGKNKKYLEFDLEFRSLSPGKVDLSSLNFTGSTPKTWSDIDGEKYYQYNDQNETNASIETSAANAARVGFYELNIEDDNRELTLLNAYQEASGTEAEHGGTFPNNGYITTETDGVVTSISGNNFSIDKPVVFGQWSYLTGSKSIVIKDKDNNIITNQTLANIDLLAALSTTDIDLSEEKGVSVTLAKLVTGQAGDADILSEHYHAKITVRIWIEGWDADAYDSIFELPLNVNFVFEKNEI